MTKRHLLLLAMILCGWRASASPAGDVNGDGVVDVADLYRARKIADGELVFEPAADVDGDSVVTQIDTWLIQEAVLGRAVPELVDSASIGPSGGSLSDRDILISVPPGSTGSHHLALLRCAGAALDDDTPLHAVYMVCGLSTNLAGFSVSYTNCSNDTGLVVGSYVKPYDSGEMRWHWQALPGLDFVRNGTQISRSFLAPGASDLAISHSLKFALVTANAPPPVGPAKSGATTKDAPVATLRAPGHRYAGYQYTGWISDKFHVYTRHWGTVSYSDLEAVCGYLYATHGKLKTMGFPLDTTLASIFPLEVYVIRGMTDDGGMVNNPVTGAHRLEINAALLAHLVELKSTVGHELMHYVLKEYNRGDAFAFESTEDAITTWFETVASDNPSHLSGNYTSRRAAPLKSLFLPITHRWYGVRNWKAQEQHGYGTSAFVDHCFDAHRDWILEVAQKVKSGHTIERALDDMFVEQAGPLHGLDAQYLAFARDYLMTETNGFTANVHAEEIFDTDSSTDVSTMYKSVSIKKATTNLLEEQKVDMSVQDYGCGVIQFALFKPERIFAPHTSLRVTAPKLCTSVDLILHYKDSNKVFHREIVKGTFGPNAEGDNEWSCVTALPEDTTLARIFALAVVGNEGEASNYTEQHAITLSYQFLGDYYMPMQEDFISYRELSSASTYYYNQVFADAIFRIVDPSHTAGLEHFTVGRHALGTSYPDDNYGVRSAFSVPQASRKTVDAFQIRLFSDATVPQLPPFTIHIGSDGSSPWTLAGQTPVPAADGSPQMELMVYHYPNSASGQVTPGESAYRTQHRVTSVNELKQRADGQAGGILVDIPAQIDDYGCVIYLFASETGESLGPMAFVTVIDPKPAGGP